MREDLTEVLLGAAVIAVAAGFLLYGAQTTGFAARQGGGYDLSASFRSAEGVLVGTDVRMSGVKIGTVTAISLNPATFRADTTLRIAEGIPVPEDSTAVVASEGLLGGTFVEIVPGGAPGNLAPGGEIVDTQGAVSLLNLLVQFAAGGGTAGP